MTVSGLLYFFFYPFSLYISLSLVPAIGIIVYISQNPVKMSSRNSIEIEIDRVL